MLRVENISKSFGGIKALQNISITFDAGTVHAVCGENGAGKSTLMNIISGTMQPETGAIYWREKPCSIPSVIDAREIGIAIVHQEKSLVDSLSVAENIYALDPPGKKWGFIDFETLYSRAAALLAQLGMQDLSVRTPVLRLSAAQKAMVEIAKALASSPSLLILDEPTASLTYKETNILFDIIRKLKQEGVAVIYITHRMKEIQLVADTVSVLKDGKYQGTFPVNTVSQDELIKRMVGRELEEINFPSHAKEEVLLSVRNISGRGIHDISFDVHKGEVFGISGLEGAGKNAIANALFGDVTLQGGVLRKKDQQLSLSHPADAIANRIAYLPDDRKTTGLFIEKSVSDNIVAAHLIRGLYDRQSNEALAAGFCERLQIRTPGVRQRVQYLSGGNQQKVMLARWLSIEPDLLILHEPTLGVDVGARAEIYRIINDLTSTGTSIILISSDLTELLLLSDRIGVLYNGAMQAIVNSGEASEENITRLASGFKLSA